MFDLICNTIRFINKNSKFNNDNRMEYLEKGYLEKDKSFNQEILSKANKLIFNLKLNDIKTQAIKENNKCYSVDLLNFINPDKKRDFFCFIKKTYQPFINQILAMNTELKLIKINYNFYNENSKLEGAKLFHRDGDTFGEQIKVFLPMTDINENNGMFYFIPNKKINKNSVIISDFQDTGVKRKARLTDFKMSKYVNEKDIKTINSDGNSLILDTQNTYHKGGNILNQSAFRIMIFIVFTPKLTFTKYSENYKNSKIYNFLFRVFITLAEISKKKLN
tara:strand:+ start:1144 stop:1974 length:831 start_codon:yes stop_codon:yes gene_type:complete